jgi:class 3 adenylate cyclase/predicted ATPase
MEFLNALTLATALLYYKRRISCRALQRVFDLEDDAFEDLKLELVEVEGVAIEQEHGILVWAGAERVDPDAIPFGPPPAASLEAPRGDAAIIEIAEQRSGEPVASDAERRQLTVMFCDLAGSTALSTRLDPEDLQGVIRAYQDAATEAIRSYQGFIAKYMGDGIVAYFGYPQAHGNDAESAVRAALDIVDAMAGLNAEIGEAQDVELSVRVGIATGIVVVGDVVGEGEAQERAVVGETPNLAARLQGLAEPNEIVIGSVTKDLAGDVFIYEDRGAYELKGITGLVKAWRASGLNEVIERESGDDVAGGRLPLLGRDEEVGLLRRAWQQTKDEGRGQAVLIAGEPGIGKTVLVDELRAQVREEGGPRIAFRCSPYHTGSALYPVIEHLKRFLNWRPEDTPATRLEKLETMLSGYTMPLAEVVPLFAALLSLELPEERYLPLSLSPQQLRQHTQDALIAWTFEEAERRPMLEIWEDLQWADPTTLEVLGLLLEQAPTAALLLVLTFRPEFAPPWPSRSHMTPLTLNRLERPQTEMLATRLAGGKMLPQEVMEHIVGKTDGVPLYVEELTKTILGSGVLSEAGDHYALTGPLSAVAIPATLQESLMARLDRLPKVREVAQLGAVLGREFTYEMLRALAEVEEPTLREGLGQLVDAELLYQRGRPPRARYFFKHALVQDAAYQSLLRRTRQLYHERVAKLLATRSAESVDTEPELLAYHYAGAGLAKEAIEYWLKAAKRAAKRSAYAEALAHLNEGIELLDRLPPGDERIRQALQLQIHRATALLSAKGMSAPETGKAFNLARELCGQLGEDVQEIFPTLWGIFTFHNVRSEYDLSYEVAQAAMRRAERQGDPWLQVLARRMIAPPLVLRGELKAARAHLEEMRALYDPVRDRDSASRFGVDFKAGGVAFLGQATFVLGFADQALAFAQEALGHAEALRHSTSISFALNWLALVHCLRREPEAALDGAERAMTLSREHGLAQWLVSAKARRGHALVELGEVGEGIATIREALHECRAMDSRLYRPFNLAALAVGVAKSGDPAEAMALMTEALDETEQTGERWSEAEIHRLKGALLLGRKGSDTQAEAEVCFRRSLEVARGQHAKAWELRTASDLARLWGEQGRREEALELLAPTYDWFTEGFETPDLRDAKTLLDELGSRSAA